MLRHLHVKNFAIAPELELDFRAGFTAITGETGAGKSILVDALGLLLGDRSDTSWVRDGAERAELSAEFDVSSNARAQAWLAQAELDMDGECLLRRSIGANGRSRAWINGSAVTVQQLAELGEHLVEIHGQNEHMGLVRPASQLRLLDLGSEHGAELQATQAAYRRWKDLDVAFQELLSTSAMSDAELDLLRYQCRELEDDVIPADQLAELETEHRILSRGSELIDTLASALERLHDDEGAISDELSRIQASLRSLEEFDAEVAGARRLLEEAAINIQEAASGLRAATRRIDLSPERLATVRAKLDRLGDLARKHHVPMERLAEHREALNARRDQAENFSERREELQRELGNALAAYREQAALLSARRADRAGQLASQVSSLMGELGMRGGVFEIAVEHAADGSPTERGSDRVQLLVSANPGFAPGPLAKIASGGELSRISLAIKVAGYGNGERRTQVFDEVDAGIGGETANAVGRLLQRLSADGQALCVTHLAQVAACAQWQVRVDKQVSDETVAVDTKLLEGDQRVEEIARMLSGTISPESREHARQLLAEHSG